MNLLAARLVLRQRSLADSLDLALPFCLANKRPLGLLSLVMLGPIAALPEVRELNIGHFLIGEAIFTGLDAAIRQMRAAMDAARSG